MNPLAFVKILCLASCAWALSACSQNTPSMQPTLQPSSQNTIHNMNQTHINITVGTRVFTATMDENPSTAAFKAMLPMTIEMNELNGKEKYHELGQALPVQAARFTTIESGDLMLYGTNTLVIFYKTFPNNYTYTRLGRIDNPSELMRDLGADNVTVKFDWAK